MNTAMKQNYLLADEKGFWKRGAGSHLFIHISILYYRSVIKYFYENLSNKFFFQLTVEEYVSSLDKLTKDMR